MHRATLLAATFVGFLVCGAATADPAATVPTDPNAPDPDKIVCRTMEPTVGTRLGARRECATQREWDQRRTDAQKALSDSQNHTFMQSGGH